mgnify:CR=1 FL=1
MSLRIIWRSAVFILTIMFIYLLFPILIVPSSLPAIKTMVIDNEYPREFFVSPEAQLTESDYQIYQLEIPPVPTIKDKLDLIKTLHQQGMKLILAPVLP